MSEWITGTPRLNASISEVPAGVERMPAAASASNAGGEEAAVPDAVVLDADRLQILRELGPADGLGLLPDAIRAFRQDAQTTLEALRTALGAGQAAAVEAAAHKLAGAASNIGAAGAAVLCKDLERFGREAGPDLASIGMPVLTQLQSELEQVDVALERTLQGAS